MYIKKIEFTNFRGFQELSLDLPENLAVLIGWNGSGKTTILDGIYKFFLAYIFHVALLQDSETSIKYFPHPKIGLDDRYNNNQKSRISFEIFSSFFLPPQRIDKTQVFFCDFIREDRYRISMTSKIPNLTDYSKALNLFIKNNPNWQVPILTYYSVASLNSQKIEIFSNPEKYLIPEIEQYAVYKDPLVDTSHNLKTFYEWFKYEEDYENEIRLRKNLKYRNNKLEIIRSALARFLNSLNSQNNSKFSDLQIVRNTSDQFTFDSRGMKPELTIAKDDIDLKLSQLSDGEKKCILIVADIARRLAIANPGLEVSDVLKQGKGIILIDEIEAHLHPGWQREIIPALTQTFPSCQFIVTTHSPQVLSKVNSENIFILENGMVINAKDEGYHTYGRTSNSILSELMEVPERPFDIKNRLKDCFNLIDEGFQSKDDNKIKQAKDELLKLSNELGEDDLDIVSLNTSFNFRSKIKRNK
ncbi:MAG: AAA family ATPase [Crocosphaera sp.]